jgi:hypothetical protein
MHEIDRRYGIIDDFDPHMRPGTPASTEFSGPESDEVDSDKASWRRDARQPARLEFSRLEPSR